jgi:hypothetical protein
VVEFSDVLYNNDDFLSAVARSLSQGGVIVAQVGEAPWMNAAPRSLTRKSVVSEGFISRLKNHDFFKITEYAEGHGGLLGVWTFLVAFKDRASSERWYATEAEVDLSIRHRLLPTRSGSPPLHFFDGSVMKSYSFPSRIVEEVFCREDPPPGRCSEGHGFDPDRPAAPSSSFIAANSSIPGAGRGVFFKESFPKDTYITLDDNVNSVLVMPRTKRIIKGCTSGSTVSTKLDAVASYILGYGYATDFFGDPAFFVDSGATTFTNHGCNGTANVGEPLSVTEATADVEAMPPELDQDEVESSVYDPFVDRNMFVLLMTDVTGRDVQAGEEMTDNYLKYLHHENWKWGVEHLRSVCSGEMGFVAEREVRSSHSNTLTNL